jgi:hypothetical protein
LSRWDALYARSETEKDNTDCKAFDAAGLVESFQGGRKHPEALEVQDSRRRRELHPRATGRTNRPRALDRRNPPDLLPRGLRR